MAAILAKGYTNYLPINIIYTAIIIKRADFHHPSYLWAAILALKPDKPAVQRLQGRTHSIPPHRG